MEMIQYVLGILGIGGFVLYKVAKTNGDVHKIVNGTPSTNYDKVVSAYNEFSVRFDPSITLDMILRMWSIESNNSNPKYLFRAESHLGASQSKWSLYHNTGQTFDDASLGALQILTGTANWLYTDMGYTGVGAPTLNNMQEIRINVYFAMSYLDWVAKRKRKSGGVPDVKFLVMSYNGGYGANNTQTRNHYNKYMKV